MTDIKFQLNLNDTIFTLHIFILTLTIRKNKRKEKRTSFWKYLMSYLRFGLIQKESAMNLFIRTNNCSLADSNVD